MLVGILAGLAMFVGRKFWPFVVKQYERQAAELALSHEVNQKMIRDFLGALERRDAEFDKIVKAIDNLTINVDRLSNRIEILVQQSAQG